MTTQHIDIMAFAPHPDDAELFCGGILLKMKERGHTTGVVDLTQGEMSSQGETERRKAEIDAASAILQLDYRTNLNLRDGAIGLQQGTGYLDPDGELAQIAKEIRLRRPTVILIPYWEDRHPDHCRASKLVTEAVFYAGVRKFCPEVPTYADAQALYYQMRYTFTPSFICDISSVHSRKLEAISCYASQIQRDRAEPGVATLVSSPLTLDMTRARDQFYGVMIGVQYGEPFLARNSLALEDPVEYFKERRGTKAHLYVG